MNEKITEKDLYNDFSAIEKLIKEWESFYLEPIYQDNTKDESTPTITEPNFIYEIHTST